MFILSLPHAILKVERLKPGFIRGLHFCRAHRPYASAWVQALLKHIPDSENQSITADALESLLLLLGGRNLGEELKLQIENLTLQEPGGFVDFRTEALQ